MSGSGAVWWAMLSVAALTGACTSDVGRVGDAVAPASSSRSDAAAAPSRADVERSWSLIALEGTPVVVPTERARPTLSFDPKTNRVSGMAGVNRFGGPYVIEKETLKLGPLMATKMAGPPELNALETRFLRALERATAWRMDGGELVLRSGDEVLARFAPQR